MSRNELIEAYRRGRISRRRFIQGMTAAGVSAVAAAGMADRMRVQAAPGSGASRGAASFTASTPDDVYPTAVPTAVGGTTDGTTGGTTTLPSTGVGDGDGGSSLWKPVAVAGAAAAAFFASRLRKIRGSESE